MSDELKNYQDGDRGNPYASGAGQIGYEMHKQRQERAKGKKDTNSLSNKPSDSALAASNRGLFDSEVIWLAGTATTLILLGWLSFKFSFFVFSDKNYQLGSFFLLLAILIAGLFYALIKFQRWAEADLKKTQAKQKANDDN